MPTVNKDPEKIYLSALREGDRYVVRDQYGRELANLRALDISVDWQDVVRLRIEVLDAPTGPDGKVHTGQGA